MTRSFFFRGTAGRNEWWWYVLTIILVITGMLGFGGLPWQFALRMKGFTPEQYLALSPKEQSAVFTNNEALSYNLFPFIIGFVMLLIAFRMIHRKPGLTYFTNRPRLDARRFLVGFALWGAIQGILFTIGYFQNPGALEWNYDPQQFFLLLAICLFLVPLQTGFEELLCRGYVLQWIGGSKWGTSFANTAAGEFLQAKRKGAPPLNTSIGRTLLKITSRGIVAAAINALIFCILHVYNPEVRALGWFALLFYTLSGFFAAFLTVMDDGIELAWGYHTANNFMGLLIVSTPWQVLRTDSLFLDTSKPAVGYEYLITLLCYPLMVFLLARIYRWKHWKARLWSPLSPAATEERRNDDELPES